MSASPKGYASDNKSATGAGGKHSTVVPVTEQRYGLDVNAHLAVESIGTDSAETGSTTTSIKATAHAAKSGDIIRFTSGSLSGREVVATSITANNINVDDVLPSAPANGDTLTIYRHARMVVDSTGKLQTTASVGAAPISFNRDTVDTTVNEDTSVPANNRALPVKLVDETSGALGTASNPIRVNPTASVAITAASLPLPSGAATSAKQPALGTAGVSSIDVISVQGIASGTALPISAAALPLPSGAATAAKQPALGTAGVSAIDVISVQGIASGTAMPVSAASLPLPTGAATETTLAAASAKLPAALGQLAKAASMSVTIATDQPAPLGRTCVAKATIDYTGTSVTSAAYVQLISSVGGTAVNEVEIFDSNGNALILATGGAGSETDICYVVPGGNGRIPLKIAASTRVALKAVSTSATAGLILVNFYS